jgi:uncharacterized protein
MKPGDHPEFFRFPAPEGRSRESTIVLDRSGRFWHEGELVTHAGMQSAFASWIRRHPDDGRYILSNGFDWTYFQVEDVPFFVRSLRAEGERPWLLLSDGTEEPLDAESVRLGAADAIYVRVKDGVYEARFTPVAQTALAPFLVEGPGGEPELQVLGKRYSVAARASRN